MYHHFGHEKIQTLNQAELDVYNYCTNNIAEIPTMSIQKLSDITFVSKTTVVRMCKKLGFEGFSEFRYFLKTLIDEQEQRQKITLNDIQKIRKYDIDNILGQLNSEKMKELANKIKDKRITFFGKGLSELVADYAKTQLSLLGLNISSYDNTTHIMNRQGSRMKDKDVLIMISASGKTRQCLELAKIVKNTDAMIISLTEAKMNPLSEMADVSLSVVMTEDQRVDFDNKSRVPMFILMQHLIDLLVDSVE